MSEKNRTLGRTNYEEFSEHDENKTSWEDIGHEMRIRWERAAIAVGDRVYKRRKKQADALAAKEIED